MSDFPNLTARINQDPERSMPVRSEHWFPEDFTHHGHTEMDLRVALEAVRDTGNWKMAVEANLPELTSDERSLVFDALIYYAGSPSEIYTEADGSVTVVSAGYYSCIGA